MAVLLSRVRPGSLMSLADDLTSLVGLDVVEVAGRRSCACDDVDVGETEF